MRTSLSKCIIAAGGLTLLASTAMADGEGANADSTIESGLTTNVELGVEREWLKPEDKAVPGIQSDLFRAGVDVAVMDLPISLGAYGAVINYSDDDVGDAEDSHGTELGVNLRAHLSEDMTGLPLGFYAKVEAPVYSEVNLADFKANDQLKTTLSHKSGNKIALGARVAVSEGTYVFGEAASGKRTYEVTTKDTTQNTANETFTTASVTVGLTRTL